MNYELGNAISFHPNYQQLANDILFGIDFECLRTYLPRYILYGFLVGANRIYLPLWPQSILDPVLRASISLSPKCIDVKALQASVIRRRASRTGRASIFTASRSIAQRAENQQWRPTHLLYTAISHKVRLYPRRNPWPYTYISTSRGSDYSISPIRAIYPANDLIWRTWLYKPRMTATTLPSGALEGPKVIFHEHRHSLGPETY